ncbi:MFS transporter [Paenibacillus sp. V4I7]|uniref:MFS transporter n=1 Tax=Paenibacillus sp. V4I7 TaxID=3042307 RepID=UPI00278712DA|nr:MFS transporter [Paenibacillus sp. V4I7]MDQ0902432.1 MFS family permease [Paenibacillus sp. V4I7]
MWMMLKDRRMMFLMIANILSSIGSGITMIGVPWLLVNRSGGSEIFGYATLASTIILFFLSPHIGVYIDRISRKKMLLGSEVVGGSVTLLFALWGLSAGHFETWQLIVIYFSGSLYYNVHFPTQFAFTQEIFSKEQYKTLNSILEVQNQSTSMIAGGLASLLIDHIDFAWILLADAMTYFLGFGLFLLIPYIKNRSVTANGAVSMLSNIREGFAYLKTRPLLVMFFLCALMPFLCVMVGNYLYPVYITSVLHGGANVLGAADMIFAIGAVVAGLTVPLLMQRLGSYYTTILSFVIFSLSIVFFYVFPLVSIFLLFKTLNGWGNAGSRVARNTILMEMVPNHLIGRVNSFFNTVGMGMRVLLIGVCTQIVSFQGARTAILLLGVLLVVSLIGLIGSKPLFNVAAQTKNEVVPQEI